MIDSSLPDGPWDEPELGLDSNLSRDDGSLAKPLSWEEPDAWIDDDTWIDDGGYGDENLSESLTIKYLGRQAVCVA